MGVRMAENLQRYLSNNSYPCLVFFNRTASKGKSIEDLGGKRLKSVNEVVAASDVTFFMLSNDEAIKDNVKQALTQSVSGKIFVDCSTVHPDTSAELYAQVQKSGASFVASPVFGATPVAAGAKLIFVPAGIQKDVDSLKPFMMAMGKSIMYIGEDVRKALLMKITGNVFIVGLMELSAEVQVLGEKVGLAPELLTKWAAEFAGPTAGLYFHKNSAGIYDPGANASPIFSIENALKDSGHAISLAKSVGVELPTLDNARKYMTEARDEKGDRSNLDASAIYGALRTRAGLPFENAAVKEREEKDAEQP
jgi:3-hydroxyisobutyrate dehydrogenase-like beta-hydroxyacid dehydrogenase